VLAQFPGQANRGDVRITPALSYRNFYRQFREDRITIQRRMNEVRYILKLYTSRSTDTAPFKPPNEADIIDISNNPLN